MSDPERVLWQGQVGADEYRVVARDDSCGGQAYAVECLEEIDDGREMEWIGVSYGDLADAPEVAAVAAHLARLLEAAPSDTSHARRTRICPRCSSTLQWVTVAEEPNRRGDWRCTNHEADGGKVFWFDYELDLIYRPTQPPDPRRARVVRLLAEVVAGLAVPYSITGPKGALVQAGPPWAALWDLLGGGWADADEVERRLAAILEAPTTAPQPTPEVPDAP